MNVSGTANGCSLENCHTNLFALVCVVFLVILYCFSFKCCYSISLSTKYLTVVARIFVVQFAPVN